MIIRKSFVVTALMLVLIPGVALAAWTNIGQAVNVTAGSSGSIPAVAAYTNGVYAAWREAVRGTSSQLYVKFYDYAATTWTQLGGSLNYDPNYGANSPSIAVFNGTPYVAWSEDNAASDTQVYVKYWDGATWQQLGGSLNVDTTQDATDVSIAMAGTQPYVAWREQDATAIALYQIYVKYWDGVDWVQVGGSVNVDATRTGTSPSLALASGGTPYVAYTQLMPGPQRDIYVRYWDGVAWTTLGGAVAYDAGSIVAEIVFGTGALSSGPYVAYSQSGGPNSGDVVVRWWNSTTTLWENLGTALNVATSGGFEPKLASASSVVYATWYEANGGVQQAYAKSWDGATWTQLGATSLNYDATYGAFTPAVAARGTRSYFIWKEDNGTSYDINAKMWQ